MFRRKRKLYLVFEYVDHTILEELEENPSGLDEETARKHVFQVLRAINFCHQNNVSLNRESYTLAVSHVSRIPALFLHDINQFV